MSKYELISFPDDEELARTVASQWLRQLDSVEGGNAPYCVALSGGRIARRFFAAVANLAKERVGGLRCAHFFWSAERCVPPSDPESNFAIARELLFEPLRIAPAQIHRVRGEKAPEFAAAEAEAELCRIASLNPEGQPVLELIFLGMGEDGHVASLFPGESDAAMAVKAVYRPVTATKPPPRRITLGYPALAAARQVWVLASGQGKENALRNSLAAGGNTPLGRVLRLRSQTKIFSDIAIFLS